MAEETKELLIRVSATTELLRSNLAQAERVVAGFERTTSASTARINDNFQRVGVSAGQQKAGLQQLGFQLQDVATQFASGTKASVIFAQQGGQVLQAIQLMSGGTSKFAQFMGGPWGIAISTATIALAPFIGRLLDTESAADAATSALEGLIQKRRQEQAERDKPRAASAELGELNKRRQDLETNIAYLKRYGSVADSTIIKRDEAELARVRARINEGSQSVSDEIARRFPLDRFLRGSDATTSSAGGSRSASGGAGRVSAGRVSAGRTEDGVEDRLQRVFRDNQADLQIAASDRHQQAIKDAFDESETVISEIRRQQAIRFEEAQAVNARLRDVEEQQVRFVTGLYESLFRGGTKAIWDDFKNIGLSVIAQVMAKWTLGAALGGKKSGGFDLGDAISSAFTSALGFRALGGPVLAGNPYIVGERGPELFMPASSGTIIPNDALSVPPGATMAGGAGAVIQQNFDLRGAVVTERLYQQMQGIAAQTVRESAPAIVQASTANTSRQFSRRKL